ncbi:hypothetical protein [Streptomyces xanthophaeus]
MNRSTDQLWRVLTGEHTQCNAQVGILGQPVAQCRRQVGVLREFFAHLIVRIFGQPVGGGNVQRAVAHGPGARDRVGQQVRDEVCRRNGMGKPAEVGGAGPCSY